MYNRYVRDANGNYIRQTVPEPVPYYVPTSPPPQPPIPPVVEQPLPPPTPPITPAPTPVNSRPPETQLLGKLLGHLKLSDIDAGDLLLLGLLFFLIYQKADEELIVALGLLLIL